MTREMKNSRALFFDNYFQEILNNDEPKIDKLKSLISFKNTLNFELIQNEILSFETAKNNVSETNKNEVKELENSESFLNLIEDFKNRPKYSESSITERLDYIQLIERVDFAIIDLNFDHQTPYQKVNYDKNENITAAQVSVLIHALFTVGFIPTLDNKLQLSLPLSSIFQISQQNIRGKLSTSLENANSEDIKSVIKALTSAIELLNKNK